MHNMQTQKFHPYVRFKLNQKECNLEVKRLKSSWYIKFFRQHFNKIHELNVIKEIGFGFVDSTICYSKVSQSYCQGILEKYNCILSGLMNTNNGCMPDVYSH